MIDRQGAASRWAAVGFLLVATAAQGQRIPKPGGFNIYSQDQDIQLGKEASAEVEKEMRLVTNREVLSYIEGIGKRLATSPEAGQYPYSFHVVWDDAINAFALPGGPVYLNTGLILAAENEAQLAGVMGHEMSHVALRHGTKQASKAQAISMLATLGGSALGGGSILGELAQAGIGLGANSVLLKYSRGAESDADLLGAHIMSEAGYNPIEASRFFEKLQAETGKQSGLETFFSDHPDPGNRSKRIEEQLPYMAKGPYNGDTGQLARVQKIVKGMGPPPAPPKAATTSSSSTTAPAGGTAPAGTPPPVAKPSAQYRTHQGQGFALDYPENWQVFADNNSASATFVPEGGVVQSQGGSAIGRGVVVDYQDLGRRPNLEQDTQALADQLRKSNPSMQSSNRRARRLKVGGADALLTTLSSDSPYGGGRETDMLLTVARPSGLYYMVFITPQAELRQHQAAFDHMMRSVRFN